jgi:hypothetical protein
MERNFLEVDGCYIFRFPDGREWFVKVLNVFANNFAKVYSMNSGYRYGVTKGAFNDILCTKVSVNLNSLESVREVEVVG